MRKLILITLFFPFIIYAQETGYTRDLTNRILDHDPSLDSISRITIDNSILMRVDQFKKIGLSFSTGIETIDYLEYVLSGLNIDFIVDGILASSDSKIDITNKKIIEYEYVSKKKVRRKYAYQTEFGAFSITTND